MTMILGILGLKMQFHSNAPFRPIELVDSEPVGERVTLISESVHEKRIGSDKIKQMTKSRGHKQNALLVFHLHLIRTFQYGDIYTTIWPSGMKKLKLW